MSRETARVEIVAAIQAAAAAFAGWTVLVDYENRDLVDFDTQEKPYLAVDLVYYDGKQMDLGPNPLVGAYGSIALAVCVKEGKGTSESNLLIDHMTKALQLKRWPVVQTAVGQPQGNLLRKGWFCMVTLINFWYHEPA